MREPYLLLIFLLTPLLTLGMNVPLVVFYKIILIILTIIIILDSLFKEKLVDSTPLHVEMANPHNTIFHQITQKNHSDSTLNRRLVCSYDTKWIQSDGSDLGL